jgi:uncharacterized protein (DUF2384 family)
MAEEPTMAETKRAKPHLAHDRTPGQRSAKASSPKSKSRKSKVSSRDEAIRRVISDIKHKHSAGGVRVHVRKSIQFRSDSSRESIFKSVYDQDGTLSVDRVADEFRLSKGQLAETVGVNREALYKTSRAVAPKTQSRIREMVEIIERIKEWAGGKDQAMAWYRSQPIPAFGGRTAESLVKDGKAGALRDYLDHLAMGGFA